MKLSDFVTEVLEIELYDFQKKLLDEPNKRRIIINRPRRLFN